MTKLSLDNIIEHWRSKDLLRHEDYVREFAKKLKDLGEIPLTEIRKNVELLKLWPLIEINRLHMKSVARDLNSDDKRKLSELKTKYEDLKISDDAAYLGSLDRLEGLSINYLNPHRHSLNKFAKKVTLDICKPLKTHMKNTKLSKTKLFHDAILGGTVYIVASYKDSEKNMLSGEFSFLQRSFICVNYKAQPVYFMDNIESGDYSFKKLDQWRGIASSNNEEKRWEKIKPNRIEDVFYSVGAAMFIADMLDISKIAPRDYELSELARSLGIREKKIFDKEPSEQNVKRRSEWKIGLDSRKKHSGVYSHSLYRGNDNYRGQQTRFQVLEQFPFQDTSKIYDELARWHNIILDTNRGRKKLSSKSHERADVILSLYMILKEHPQTPRYRLGEAYQKLKEAYGRVYKTRPPIEQFIS